MDNLWIKYRYFQFVDVSISIQKRSYRVKNLIIKKIFCKEIRISFTDNCNFVKKIEKSLHNEFSEYMEIERASAQN